ncbi:uncharacterized protein [Triticum aestivum]|uniref:uncharacterized protein n=1 Tax=Triticum aestivum TaxID=4565 RepID=UPI001D02F2D1|nr:uncharacterized protein LOC123141683 [Triticum aestivum]
MARLQMGRRRAVWRLRAGLLVAAAFAGGGAARARHPARGGDAATVASRASTRRRGCGVCPRGGWLSSSRSVGGMAAEVAVAGRRWRNFAGCSGEVLSGSRGGGPGGWLLVKLGLLAAAWHGAVPVQGGSVTAICFGLVRIRDGDERAGSFSAALAAWRGRVGALLLGSSGGTLRQWPVRQGSHGGTVAAVGRRI